MEIYELSDKEFRIIFLKNFSELRKYRQLKAIRKRMHKQTENSTKKYIKKRKNTRVEEYNDCTEEVNR